MGKKKPPKTVNVLARIKEHVGQGRYLETIHAQEQMKARDINRLDVQYVLCNGSREKGKDAYRGDFAAWTYAIRGLTLDEDKELRVIVSVRDTGVCVVTAIDLVP